MPTSISHNVTEVLKGSGNTPALISNYSFEMLVTYSGAVPTTLSGVYISNYKIEVLASDPSNVSRITNGCVEVLFAPSIGYKAKHARGWVSIG